MGARESITGYRVQVLATILEGLQTSDWDYVALEPDTENEKVDIQWWYQGNRHKSAQVKWSGSVFSQSVIKKTIDELIENDRNAFQYEVILAGLFTPSAYQYVKNFKKIRKRAIATSNL